MMTKRQKLKKDLDGLQAQLVANKKFMASSDVQSGKAFMTLIESRIKEADSSLTNLDINIDDSKFKLIYAMKKEVQLEYSTLLALLRDASKREECIIKEMSKISDDIERLETESEKSPRF